MAEVVSIVLVVGTLAFLTYKGILTLWRTILIGLFSLLGPVWFLLKPVEGQEFLVFVWGGMGAVFGIIISKIAGYIYNWFARPVKKRTFRAGDEISFLGRAAFRDLKGHRATVIRKQSHSYEGSTVLYYILKIDDGREVKVEESDVEGFAEEVGK